MPGEYAQYAEETTAYRALRALPDDIPQAQYSTYLQLVILSQAAVRLGLYDAADFLRKAVALAEDHRAQMSRPKPL
jgi:hypothetical protein